MMKLLNKDFLKTAFFALFVSLVLLFVVFEIKKFKSEEDVKETRNRVLKLDYESVNRLNFKGSTFIRSRDKGIWRLVSPFNDYLNFKAVEDWLAKSLSFDGRVLSDPGEEVKWTDFGFESNLPKVTYFSEKDLYTVTASKKRAFDGSVYLKYQKNKESPLLISSDPEWKEFFEKKPLDFRSLKAFDWNIPEPTFKTKVLKISKKNKEILSIFKEGEKWESKNKPDWSLNEVKIDSFLSDIKQYMHKGFNDGKIKLGSPDIGLFVSNGKNSSFSINLYKKNKNSYAVASYRPEHVLRLDLEALDDFNPNLIEFRELSDLIKGFKVDDVKVLKIRKNDENKVFRLKDNLWFKTDGKKVPAGFEFNGAKVFKFLEVFNDIQYKRYIKETKVVFRSAKKKLYFYKNQKKIDLTYSLGQSYPCSLKSKDKDQCILVATNKVQGYYGVALKDEVNSLFKIGFIQKQESPKKVDADNKKQDK